VQSIRVQVTRFQPFNSRPDAVVGLAFRYDAQLVTRLKEILRAARLYYRGPGYPGGWPADHKRWFIEPAAWPFVRRRLVEADCVLDEDVTSEEDNGRATTDKPTTGSVAALEPVLRDLYRKMALRFHPDRGGSVEVMQAINYAHDELRRLITAARADQ
jgi:hypothetical protein